ncbi:TSL-kinase interacting protein 1-like isoform X1 [Asparagus officinalis]|uniref:TSL-kinase interacting protein 1-like isoform X1 n=1 Tax=Asparagus officinalis TaxID=4686 RepID=UPI00098E4CF5|nr:TSL-kinase interacting protein 1-like isoform X1 [Asparagus officinalis]XP_020270025.1 TSL-kinase interacting protein 1-like isoform X1 [Asparagus officinalis]
MKTEQHRKKMPTSSTKGKAVRGLSCTKSGISTDKISKQRSKKAGNKLLPLHAEQQGQKTTITSVCKQSRLDHSPSQLLPATGDQLITENGEELQFPTPPVSSAASASVPRPSICFQKFKLQLFPIDEVTLRALEMEKHNPYLELTIGTRKKISSVVKHLNVKWGTPTMTTGELMLFPYYTQTENLMGQMRWTLKDTNTSASDVHVAIGNPAIFRLRYGWFSNTEPSISSTPLISPFSESSVQIKENEIKDSVKIVDHERHLCCIASQENAPAPAEDSPNEDVRMSSQLDKTIQSLDNQRTANSQVLLWDISNISFGALLSDASRNVNISQISCDSFDAAFDRFKAKVQPASVPSILDAEETCNAFSFRKTPSSTGTDPAQTKDAPAASCIQNIWSNPSRFHDADNACKRSPLSQQLHTTGEACLQSGGDSQNLTQDVIGDGHKSQAYTQASHGDTSHTVKLDICWPESLGPWEYATPASKQFVGGDSIGLDGLIASSLDSFQNFSIF